MYAARSAEACVAVYEETPAEPLPDWLHYMNPADSARSSLIIDWFIRFDRSLTERYPEEVETAALHEQVREYVRKAAPLRAGELA